MRSVFAPLFMLSLLPATMVCAQDALPNTEVFLAPTTFSDSAIDIGVPVNISHASGYDNQPSFLPDSSAVLFTSDRDGKQTDIYRYRIADQQLQQLTHTAANEYSALVSADGKSFVCVHGAEQSLFRYHLDGSHPHLAYQLGKKLIGYHLWITPTQIAAFILGDKDDSNNLHIINTNSKKSTVIATGSPDIGRSLLMRPGAGTMSFIAKTTPEKWEMKEMNIKTHAVTSLTETLPGSEDITWMKNGSALMGQGSKLYTWKQGETWKQVADFAEQGLNHITRLAQSPDGKWVAIVAEMNN